MLSKRSYSRLYFWNVFLSFVAYIFLARIASLNYWTPISYTWFSKNQTKLPITFVRLLEMTWYISRKFGSLLASLLQLPWRRRFEIGKRLSDANGCVKTAFSFFISVPTVLRSSIIQMVPLLTKALLFLSAIFYGCIIDGWGSVK